MVGDHNVRNLKGRIIRKTVLRGNTLNGSCHYKTPQIRAMFYEERGTAGPKDSVFGENVC